MYFGRLVRLNTLRRISMFVKPASSNGRSTFYGRRTTFIGFVTTLTLTAVVGWSAYGTSIHLDAFSPLSFLAEEVMKHTVTEDCWVVIEGKVYDVSKFLAAHPGGAAVILRCAGGDATSAFRRIHNKLIINTMQEHVSYLGPLKEGEVFPTLETDAANTEMVDASEMPSLSQIFNLLDFEYVAKKVLPRTTFTYYATGASDEYSIRENHYSFLRVFFRPKVLQNLENVTIGSTVLGIDVDLPIYISGFAGSNLAHPDAEWNLQRAAFKQNVVQMVPKQMSIDFGEFFNNVPDGQQFWVQHHFYNSAEMADMDTYLSKYHSQPSIKGIFFNVDVVDLGNREKDSKVRALDAENLQALQECADNGTVKYCTKFTWDVVCDLVKKSRLPVGLKGVQRGEDVVQAAECGVAAVVLSNHGGRQLDFSRPPLEVLVEARTMLKERGLEDKIEIYIDGGIRRGSDIIKALCLGAKGVGLGRPFLYSMAGYGEEGVEHVIKILKNEMRNNMMLLGASSISELDESLVDVSNLKFRNPNVNNRLYENNYIALSPPPWRAD